MSNRTEEDRLADPTASLRLRPPFRQFWRWWGFFGVVFPLLGSLAEWVSAGFTRWVVILTWVLLFFWSARGPMEVWLQRPKPVWLFVVLWMVVPFAWLIAVSALFRLADLWP